MVQWCSALSICQRVESSKYVSVFAYELPYADESIQSEISPSSRNSQLPSVPTMIDPVHLEERCVAWTKYRLEPVFLWVPDRRYILSYAIIVISFYTQAATAMEDARPVDAQWLQQIEEYRVETTVNVEPPQDPVRISPEIAEFLEEQGEVRLGRQRRLFLTQRHAI